MLEHGCGALAIDQSRVGTSGGTTRSEQAGFSRSAEVVGGSVHATRGWRTGHTAIEIGAGRWPANVLLLHRPECHCTCSGSCAVADLDEAGRFWWQGGR